MCAASSPVAWTRLLAVARQLREVVFVDAVRTAFGRAGPKGVFWRTRADDLGVKVVRELLRRNPQLDPRGSTTSSWPRPRRSATRA